MSDTKFTPGPWGYSKGYEGSGPFDRMELSDSDDNVIAKLDRTSEGYGKLDEYNFLLMAASPDLYAMVKDLTRALEVNHSGATILVEARELLKRARGES